MWSLILALVLAVSPLQAHADAQAHAMADAGYIYHSDLHPLLGYCGWAAENVGVGPSWEAVDAALDASPGHRANRVYPWTEMARTVYEQDGLVWVVEVFCVNSADDVPDAPVSAPTRPISTPATYPPVDVSGDAGPEPIGPSRFLGLPAGVFIQ